MYVYINMYIYIYICIYVLGFKIYIDIYFALNPRGVIAEWIKAASGNLKVVSSNPSMSDFSMEIFPIFMGKLT